MAYPVFASGDVLNASDMNAVGLWLVKTQTVGTAVSSVQVTGAFSSSYDSYKIIFSGGVGSASTDLGLRLGSTTTDYYGGVIYLNYASTTVSAANDNAQARFRFVGGCDTAYSSLVCDVIYPFQTKQTMVFANSSLANGNFGTYNGRQATNTSFTDFTIVPGAGTLTGGTIRVYGYRN